MSYHGRDERNWLAGNITWEWDGLHARQRYCLRDIGLGNIGVGGLGWIRFRGGILSQSLVVSLCRILALGVTPGKGFLSKLSDKLKEYGIEQPTVQIEFRQLTVATDALVGNAGIPTVANVGTHALKVCCNGHQHSRHLNAASLLM